MSNKKDFYITILEQQKAGHYGRRWVTYFQVLKGSCGYFLTSNGGHSMTTSDHLLVT